MSAAAQSTRLKKTLKGGQDSKPKIKIGRPKTATSLSCFRSAKLEGALQVPPSSVRWCERATAGAADRKMQLHNLGGLECPDIVGVVERGLGM